MSDEIVLIQNLIYEIRGQKVMLDSDLAKLYQVETRVLNQAVKRNLKRFPPDFSARLYVPIDGRRSPKYVITKCDDINQTDIGAAFCLYRARCSHAFRSPEK